MENIRLNYTTILSTPRKKNKYFKNIFKKTCISEEHCLLLKYLFKKKDMEETKTCCRCGKAKQLELFVAKRKCCKECHNMRNRQWRSENVELNREIQLEYYYNVRKPKQQKQK